VEEFQKIVKTVYTLDEAAKYLVISVSELRKIELIIAAKKSKNNRLFYPYAVLQKIEKYLASPPKTKNTRKKRKKEAITSNKVYSPEEVAERIGKSVNELRKLELEVAPKKNKNNRLFYPESIIRKIEKHLAKKMKKN